MSEVRAARVPFGTWCAVTSDVARVPFATVSALKVPFAASGQRLEVRR